MILQEVRDRLLQKAGLPAAHNCRNVCFSIEWTSRSGILGNITGWIEGLGVRRFAEGETYRDSLAIISTSLRSRKRSVNPPLLCFFEGRTASDGSQEPDTWHIYYSDASAKEDPYQQVEFAIVSK